MAYTILNTDGTTLFFLPDGKVDKTHTSLDLVGKNFSGYGEYLNNNLVSLLGNFSNDTEPRSPITGQLWYDATNKRLMVYDQTFKSVNGATIASSEPTNKSDGDLWWDTVNDQLRVYHNASYKLIGPTFSKSVGENGFTVISTASLRLRDENNNLKNVSLIKNYGETIGYINHEQFRIKSTSTYSYLSTATMPDAIKGLSIVGDIQFSGKVTNKYLNLEIDINTLTPSSTDISNSSHFLSQNASIADLLDAVYPLNTTSSLTSNLKSIVPTTLYETGVPMTSLAKVLVKHTTPTTGYQVRTFEPCVINGRGQWTATNYVGTSTTLANVIYRI